jgi:hypothetical protein
LNLLISNPNSRDRFAQSVLDSRYTPPSIALRGNATNSKNFAAISRDPPPRIHLTRFFGCLAPHAKIRSQIVPKKEQASEPPAAGLESETSDAPKKSRRIGWAELLARVFNIDMLHCPSCGSENFKPCAAILEVSAIRKILIHLGLPTKPPDIAPARFSPQMTFIASKDCPMKSRLQTFSSAVLQRGF